MRPFVLGWSWPWLCCFLEQEVRHRRPPGPWTRPALVESMMPSGVNGVWIEFNGDR